MYEFPREILKILDEYKEKQTALFNPLNREFSIQAWADLRLDYHARIVTPYHDEFLGNVYIAYFESVATIKPNLLISDFIPQLVKEDRDILLEQLMFLDKDSRENYELRTRLVKGLGKMDFYQDKELPLQYLSDKTQKERRAMIL